MIKKMVIMLWALALIAGVAGCAANVPEERLTAPSSLPPDPFADADAEAGELSSKYLGSFSIKPMNYDPFAEGLLVYDGTPIELTFQLEGDVSETNVGMAFFIDGAVQPHQVIRSTQTLDGLRPADELQAVSVHRLAPEETIELTVRRYTLRIVSDERPDERAESVPPRLEEAYIYLTGGNRDDAPEG